MNTTTLGIRSIHGTYPRKSHNGYRTLNFCWWIDINDSCECQLYTNDALTDCYTSDNAYCADSLQECLDRIAQIIKEAAA